MSPRNTPEAVVDMIIKTGCQRLLTQPSLVSLQDAVQNTLSQNGHKLHIQELPHLHDVFPFLKVVDEDSPVQPYLRSSTPQQSDDLVIYLHSSGSTGLPKPIPLNQRVSTNWTKTSMCIHSVIQIVYLYSRICLSSVRQTAPGPKRA